MSTFRVLTWEACRECGSVPRVEFHVSKKRNVIGMVECSDDDCYDSFFVHENEKEIGEDVLRHVNEVWNEGNQENLND